MRKSERSCHMRPGFSSPLSGVMATPYAMILLARLAGGRAPKPRDLQRCMRYSSHTRVRGMETSWLRAMALAAIMLAASYLLFVLVPNNLLSYLSLHTTPRNRDLLVTLWWVVAFVFACWLFVRLQRTRAG